MRLSLQMIGAATLAIVVAQSEAQAIGIGAARRGVAVGPRGGIAAGHARGGAAVGPLGGVHAGAARGSTRVTPGGTTIQHGSVGGVSRGPLGGVRAGGAQATRVTTPGGRTFTTGSAGRAGVGPLGGVHVGGARGAAVAGPFGGAAVGRAGGAAVGPLGGVAVGHRAGGGVRVGAIGHATRYVSPAVLGTRAAYVRGGLGYSYFTPTWYRTHAAAWVAPRWVGPSIWVPPAWATLATFCNIAAQPVVYDYGSTVVIDNSAVYYNGEQVATADQYAEQATAYADAGRQAKVADNEEWQPLGVFGMIQGDQEVAQHIFQLAINKASVIRGNYYDAVADNTLPVYGSVDARTQRAAWSIGDKKTIVFETGLGNLAQDQTTLLVHYGKERTEQMVLVRLEQPAEEKK